MLDVRRLSLLRELANRGTIGAAAAALHLTGPAVSQQLAVLEREAGVPLLERQGRGLGLTSAGQMLLAHADVILANVAQAESDLAAIRGGALGTVRIAAFPSAARSVVSRLWTGSPTSTEQRVGLRVIEQEPEFSVATLLQREADLALIHSYSLLPRELPRCEQIHLLDEPVLLALHPDDAARHRLAPGRPARLSDFADRDWLAPGQETSCREMVQRACGAAGFVVRPIVEATDFSVQTAMVAAGAGVALIPRMALPDGISGVSLHPLRQPIIRTLEVLTRPGESQRPDIQTVLSALHLAAAAHLSQFDDQPRMD